MLGLHTCMPVRFSLQLSTHVVTPLFMAHHLPVYVSIIKETMES